MATTKEMSVFAKTIYENKYAMKANGHTETWPETADRVVTSVVAPYLPKLVPKIRKLVEERKFMPGGRYLYSAGRKYPQVNNCFLFRAEDSREGWAELLSKCVNALMTGGGIGVVYSDLREEDAPVRGLGGKSTGPCALMQIVNEAGRHIMQGGARRSAIWAGLHWNHPDCLKFIRLKSWSDLVKRGKREDFSFPGCMDGTNISVILDDAFFAAYQDSIHRDHVLAQSIYWESLRGLLSTGEPGFSVDIGENEGENNRNACCEVCSRDDSDICNLGSLNLARFDRLEEFQEAVELGTAFLLCGTLYSKLPMEKMYRVREKNRRLGLGLMGVHEWMLRRGYRYESSRELGEWMSAFTLSGAYASRFADRLSISRPLATRSIAPTGTISIVAETTSGIEPIFATALKRRYYERKQWKAQYIVDATAQRIIEEQSIDPDLIEDSLSLAGDVPRRINFQVWLQKRVDHAISSTINLPPWGSEGNNEEGVARFGEQLLSYLPKLRGITAYPSGSRDGQPLTKVPYSEAIKQLGVEFVDQSEEGCKSGVCGA